MTLHKNLRAALVVGVAVILTAGTAAAQAGMGLARLAGNVVDQAGNPIPGSLVPARIWSRKPRSRSRRCGRSFRTIRGRPASGSVPPASGPEARRCDHRVKSRAGAKRSGCGANRRRSAAPVASTIDVPAERAGHGVRARPLDARRWVCTIPYGGK